MKSKDSVKEKIRKLAAKDLARRQSELGALTEEEVEAVVRMRNRVKVKAGGCEHKWPPDKVWSREIPLCTKCGVSIVVAQGEQ